MNSTRTPSKARTALAAIALAGAGVIGVGAVASAYGGEDDPVVEETSDDLAVETSTDEVDDVDDADDDASADVESFAAADGEDGDRRGNRGFRSSESVAEVLGLSTDELRTSRSEGMSIAAIAEQQGVAVDVVVDAIVDDVEERLAEKVAAGDLTQAEADEKLATADERALERIERIPGEGCDDEGEAAETTDA